MRRKLAHLAFALAAGPAVAAGPASPPPADAPLAEDEILVVDEKDLPRMWRDAGKQPRTLQRGTPMRGKDRVQLGCVSVGFVIESDGRVRTAKVLRSDPPGALDAAGLRSARALRFEPGPDNAARQPVYSVTAWSTGTVPTGSEQLVVDAIAPCMVDIEVPATGR